MQKHKLINLIFIAKAHDIEFEAVLTPQPGETLEQKHKRIEELEHLLRKADIKMDYLRSTLEKRKEGILILKLRTSTMEGQERTSPMTTSWINGTSFVSMLVNGSRRD